MTTVPEVDPRSVLRLCHRSVEFRAAGPVTDGRTLEGYAAVFDSPTVIEAYPGDFEEVVKRGAFKRTLGARTPVLQFDHGRDKRTGSVPIGAIDDIREDSQGLWMSARLFDNDVVEPIRQSIAGQAVRGMSFRFRVMDDRWRDANGQVVKGDELAELMADPGDRGPLRREILEVDLFELGPVVFPAYDSTSVGVRGVLAQFNFDERCVRRHLALFGPDEREVLARELITAFPELVEMLERTAVPSHDTNTVSGSWDGGANVRRLPSPMPLATARAMYAWYDSDRVTDGTIVKAGCSLPHHEVSEAGRPGAANLNGVRNALSRLPQSDIPESEREAVRRHLRSHLPDDEGDDQASSEPAVSTGTSDAVERSMKRSKERERADPVVHHSAVLREPADWYLPGPSEVL